MNKFTLSLLALSVSASVTAGNLDLQSRLMLNRRNVEAGLRSMSPEQAASRGLRLRSVIGNATSADNGIVTGFVKIADGFDRNDIEAAGFNVLAVRGNVAVVSLPADSAAVFAERPGVRKLSLERQAKTLMDVSRNDTGVDAIHRGDKDAGLDVPYTGKGVMACVVDQGVDPNHVAFLDENGESRVAYLTYFDGTADKSGAPNFSLYGKDIFDINDLGQVYWYPTADRFYTDDTEAYHGTHTLNILGGGYDGDIQYANGQLPYLLTKKNPYYGVAPDVTLGVSCGSLADACIAYGLNGMLDYAAYRKQTENMPTVVSLSLGATSGPHDPNGLMNRFLDECGDEAIVVLAAGNEGDLKIALSKNLTASDNTVGSCIYPYGYRYNPSAGKPGTSNTYYRNGAVMIYSNDDRPFTIKAFVLTGEEGNYRKRATLDISSQEGNYYISDPYYANYVGGAVNSTVARYFDGYIGGGTMLDEDLGRYYGAFDYYLYTNPETGFNADGSEAVIVGFEVTGADGQRIECYCDGFNTWMSDYGMSTFMDGQCDGTISDMAVGYNVLVVGAYTLTNRWTSLDGQISGYYESDGFVKGDIGHYTSFGTLADGRTLPHVCAPGSAVISAMSTPYVETFFKGYEQYIPMNFQAKAEKDGRTYYWKQETGTSMATPFVAGAIALWLEADPTLTIDEVRDIIAKTSRRDEFVENGNQVQWGAGKFDALAGLKEVIRRASVDGITIDGHNDRLIMTDLGGGNYSIFVGEATNLNVNVISLSGASVFRASRPGCETSVDLSSLAPGVYVVNVNGHTKKIAI